MVGRLAWRRHAWRWWRSGRAGDLARCISPNGASVFVSGSISLARFLVIPTPVDARPADAERLYDSCGAGVNLWPVARYYHSRSPSWSPNHPGDGPARKPRLACWGFRLISFQRLSRGLKGTKTVVPAISRNRPTSSFLCRQKPRQCDDDHRFAHSIPANSTIRPNLPNEHVG